MEGIVENIVEGVAHNGESFWKVTFEGNIDIYFVWNKSLLKGIKKGDCIKFLFTTFKGYKQIKYITKCDEGNHIVMEVQNKLGDFSG